MLEHVASSFAAIFLILLLSYNSIVVSLICGLYAGNAPQSVCDYARDYYTVRVKFNVKQGEYDTVEFIYVSLVLCLGCPDRSLLICFSLDEFDA